MFSIFLAFCLTMTGLLIFLSKISLKQTVKRANKIYAYLFGMCSIFLIFTMFEPHKGMIDWFQSQKKPSIAIANEVLPLELEPRQEEIPLSPTVEEVGIRPAVQLNAPMISQHPELPRGCEVTSLAMLLQYYNVDVGKMELAEKVKKDKTPFQRTKEGIFFGNPYYGFVGDMYSFSNPGLGVYHGPIAELAQEYLGDRVLDFTGSSFDEILEHINANRPVWIITNATYKKLSDSYFETWQTEQGSIKITMKEHSVLVTGYDDEFIYFNEPITADLKKAPIDDFREAWVQMGKQAITITSP